MCSQKEKCSYKWNCPYKNGLKLEYRTLYSVYNLRNKGLPVIVDGTVQECAVAMQITCKSFREIASKSMRRGHKTWLITKRRANYEAGK